MVKVLGSESRAEGKPLTALPAFASSRAAGMPDKPSGLEVQLCMGLSYWGALLWGGMRLYGAVGTTLGGRHSPVAHGLTALPVCGASFHHGC